MASANPESTNKPSSTDMDLKKVFNQFDANGDGKISVSELGNVFKSMGTSYTEAELNQVLDDIDIDRDGFINMEEFAAICRSSSSATEVREAFDLYDQNKNGLISSSEIHKVLNRLGMTCSVEDCVRMIGRVDTDGDGNVNFEEFKKMMSSPELLNKQGSA